GDRAEVLPDRPGGRRHRLPHQEAPFRLHPVAPRGGRHVKPEELDRLIHRYFEGDLSPEEEGLLWSVIRIDPQSADRFVELSELESAMVESLQAEEAAPPEVRSTRRDSR